MVTATSIIPSIKTDNAAISIEFRISEKHQRSWPLETELIGLLLDDEDYVREVTSKIPIWLIEGQNELTNKSMWDWNKYEINLSTQQNPRK
mgnify:CR=1 FL=1